MSKEIKSILGCSLSNIYAEGLPDSRLYPGVEIIN